MSVTGYVLLCAMPISRFATDSMDRPWKLLLNKCWTSDDMFSKCQKTKDTPCEKELSVIFPKKSKCALFVFLPKNWNIDHLSAGLRRILQYVMQSIKLWLVNSRFKPPTSPTLLSISLKTLIVWFSSSQIQKSNKLFSVICSVLVVWFIFALGCF